MIPNTSSSSLKGKHEGVCSTYKLPQAGSTPQMVQGEHSYGNEIYISVRFLYLASVLIHVQDE